ncbi:MAG: 2OG-Fe(II) oxygenase [Azospirillaceae bacterium]|nr:2OG-Fe(II) oxygenase [Azospirillaceae bacterium]
MDVMALPSVTDVAQHFIEALRRANRDEMPYLHWSLSQVLPEAVARAVIDLPIPPLEIDDCGGVRDKDNSLRTFLTPANQAQHPVFALLAQALRRPEVARQLSQTCEFEAQGTYLRMEYIQDVDGAWLQPHHDVPAKLFSMVIYLFTGPNTSEWGTDIYDENQKWIGQGPAEFNSGMIFIPGPNTWHGYEKRKIIGVRRLIEVNYVHPSWRDRNQLAFPEQPISLT